MAGERLWRWFRRVPNSRAKAWLRDAYLRRLRERLVLALPSGLRMELDPWEWLQNQIRRDGGVEPKTTRALRALLRPGDVFVDVGAHVGWFSLVARQAVGEAGLVVAIEPQPDNASRLLANFAWNGYGNVVCYPAACGDVEAPVRLHTQPASDRSRLSLSGPSVPGDLAQQFVVPVVRLDAVLAREAPGRAFVAKIDAEGFEPQVLDGLAQAVVHARALIVEITDVADPGAQRCVDWLRARGLVLRTVAGAPWRDGEPLPENNLLAVRDGD